MRFVCKQNLFVKELNSCENSEGRKCIRTIDGLGGDTNSNKKYSYMFITNGTYELRIRFMFPGIYIFYLHFS